MNIRNGLAACAALLTMPVLAVSGAARPVVAIDADDIGGYVTSAAWPEAGVWVVNKKTAV